VPPAGLFLGRRPWQLDDSMGVRAAFSRKLRRSFYRIAGKPRRANGGVFSFEVSWPPQFAVLLVGAARPRRRSAAGLRIEMVRDMLNRLGGLYVVNPG